MKVPCALGLVLGSIGASAVLLKSLHRISFESFEHLHEGKNILKNGSQQIDFNFSFFLSDGLAVYVIDEMRQGVHKVRGWAEVPGKNRKPEQVGVHELLGVILRPGR